MLKNSSMLALCCLMSFSAQAASKKLYADEVLKTSAQHLPTIMRAKAAIDEQAGKLLSSRGAFDRRLDGKAASRLSGFYDGNYAGLNMVQPLENINGQVYGGYRISNGTYPSYDGDLETQTGGEVAVGAIFSLLRGREIDPRRFQLNNEELKLQESNFALQLEQLNAQLNALLTYLEWQAKGLEYYVRKDIWKIANERQSALASEVKAGNKASIFLVENKQNMLKRKSALRDTRRIFNSAAQGLSFFYRDTQANPIIPSMEQLPKDFILPIGSEDLQPKFSDIRQLADGLLEMRPDIKRIKLAIQRAKNEEKLASNNLLPLLDLNPEISQDFGNDKITSRQTETKVMLNLSVPIQRRDAEGKILSAKAMQRMLNHEKQIIEQQLMIELERIVNDIEIGKDLMQITEEEQKIAAKLLQAERQRFADGASDFFLLNIREETLAESRIRNIMAMQRYYAAIGRLLAVTMQNELLGIKN
jgi:outer membrane protein TolC